MYLFSLFKSIIKKIYILKKNIKYESLKNIKSFLKVK